MKWHDQLKTYNLGMNNKTVQLAAHDPRWATAFAFIRGLLETRFPLGSELYHIGSTAIPGIAAKPILDVLGAVTSLDEFDRGRSDFESLGMIWRGEYGVPNRRYLELRDEKQEIAFVHLHVFEKGNPELNKHLAFRDFLRAKPLLAQKYESLKKSLTQTLPADRTKYTSGKSEMIQELMREALQWQITAEKLYRYQVGKLGIYAAVDRDCPRDDRRRLSKPDGSWLPRVGKHYPEAISFWRDAGRKKYEESGLRAWHQSVVKGRMRIIEKRRDELEVLYEDEYQVIGLLKMPPVPGHGGGSGKP